MLWLLVRASAEQIWCCRERLTIPERTYDLHALCSFTTSQGAFDGAAIVVIAGGYVHFSVYASYHGATKAIGIYLSRPSW